MTNTSTEAVESECRNIHDAITRKMIPAVYGTRWQDILRALAAERDALKAELSEARMQAIVDFGKLQKACEENGALKAEVERLREERNEFASHVVEFSELAASLIEEMSKKPNTTWGQVKAAIRALGDLGDRSAYQIKQKSRAALQENTDD